MVSVLHGLWPCKHWFVSFPKRMRLKSLLPRHRSCFGKKVFVDDPIQMLTHDSFKGKIGCMQGDWHELMKVGIEVMHLRVGEYQNLFRNYQTLRKHPGADISSESSEGTTMISEYGTQKWVTKNLCCIRLGTHRTLLTNTDNENSFLWRLGDLTLWHIQKKGPVLEEGLWVVAVTKITDWHLSTYLQALTQSHVVLLNYTCVKSSEETQGRVSIWTLTAEGSNIYKMAREKSDWGIYLQRPK